MHLDGAHPRTVFFGFGSWANSSTESPWRYFSIHHSIYLANTIKSRRQLIPARTYLRSRTPTPADLRLDPSCFQKSSQSSIESFVSADLPMALRKASGVAIESALGMSGTCDAVGCRCVPWGSGIIRALVDSERAIRGTKAHRRELEPKLSNRLVIVKVGV